MSWAVQREKAPRFSSDRRFASLDDTNTHSSPHVLPATSACTPFSTKPPLPVTSTRIFVRCDIFKSSFAALILKLEIYEVLRTPRSHFCVSTEAAARREFSQKADLAQPRAAIDQRAPTLRDCLRQEWHLLPAFGPKCHR